MSYIDIYSLPFPTYLKIPLYLKIHGGKEAHYVPKKKGTKTFCNINTSMCWALKEVCAQLMYCSDMLLTNGAQWYILQGYRVSLKYVTSLRLHLLPAS